MNRRVETSSFHLHHKSCICGLLFLHLSSLSLSFMSIQTIGQKIPGTVFYTVDINLNSFMGKSKHEGTDLYAAGLR